MAHLAEHEGEDVMICQCRKRMKFCREDSHFATVVFYVEVVYCVLELQWEEGSVFFAA